MTSIVEDERPDYSIDLEKDSNQYLSITDGNFGSFDLSKFAVSLWFKRESSGLTCMLSQWSSTTTERAFNISFTGSDNVVVQSGHGSGLNSFSSTSTLTDTNWHHMLVHIDPTNSTAANRILVWLDGSSMPSTVSSMINNSSINNSSADIQLGAITGSRFFDGLIYQMAFFSGYLPSVSEVYDAGNNVPQDVLGITGLHSLLDADLGSVTHDAVLSSPWTNNNSAAASSSVPSLF